MFVSITFFALLNTFYVANADIMIGEPVSHPLYYQPDIYYRILNPLECKSSSINSCRCSEYSVWGTLDSIPVDTSRFASERDPRPCANLPDDQVFRMPNLSKNETYLFTLYFMLNNVYYMLKRSLVITPK